MEAELRQIRIQLERIADALGAEPTPEFETAYEDHDLIVI